MNIYEVVSIEQHRSSDTLLSKGLTGIFLYGWKVVGLNGFNRGLYLFDIELWNTDYGVHDPSEKMPYEWLVICYMAEDFIK